jgi:hypothetical protein
MIRTSLRAIGLLVAAAALIASMPTGATAQQAAPSSLAGTSWQGTETLPGYGDLTFHFHEDSTATMVDTDGTSYGTWSQAGGRVRLAFYDGTVIYDGTLSGNQLFGSARNSRTTWSWSLQGPGGGDAETEEPKSFKQTCRYLRLKNDTAEKLTVFVQYHTWTSTGTWQWYPSQPGTRDAVAYVLNPGQEADLRHEGWRLNASKVRLWAQSPTGLEYLDFQDRDLWLVEETDGERCFYAPQPETFTYTFLPPEKDKSER